MTELLTVLPGFFQFDLDPEENISLQTYNYMCEQLWACREGYVKDFEYVNYWG